MGAGVQAVYGNYKRRKNDNQIYLQHELEESNEMAHRVKLRRDRKLQPGQSNLQCRGCVLNYEKIGKAPRFLCSRSNLNPRRGPETTDANEACDRCARCKYKSHSYCLCLRLHYSRGESRCAGSCLQNPHTEGGSLHGLVGRASER